MTSSKIDTVKGTANEAVGKAKQGIGAAVGDDSLRAKGVAQELKGSAQKASGAIKDAIKKAVDR